MKRGGSMIQMRTCVFETNSSSVHSLVLCSDAEYKALKKEKAMVDTFHDTVVPFNEVKKAQNKYRYETLEEFLATRLETFEKKQKIGSVIVHAIGKYGYDG